jgi:hypothetical protein
MDNQHLWKIIGGVVALLLALSSWLIKDEIAQMRAEFAGFKAAQTMQWQKRGEDRDLFQQRLSYLEGWRDAEKHYGCREKTISK